MSKTTILERKIDNLVSLRSYELIKREELKESVMCFTVVDSRKDKKLLIWGVSDKMIGVAYVKKLKKAMEDVGMERGIILSHGRYTFAAKRMAEKCGIELIPKNFPVFNIFKHELVPKHEILSPEEAKKLLKKYRLKPHQLPMIKSSDIVVIAIGAKPGDILRIVRDSATTGKHVTYKLVVPA